MLDRKNFLIKERVGFLKLVGTYDILDPATGSALGTATENISGLLQALRLVISKRMLPTTIEICAGASTSPVLTIKRTGFLRPTVRVLDAAGKVLGSFKGKIFSIGGGFFLLDAGGQQIGEVKGDWKGWNFRFLNATGAELGTVTKKWAGIGKELFTTADNYMIALNEGARIAPETGALLLAAGLALDTIYKERK